ncbi:MAG: efflux RND transporter permease subunit, partial [Planctomycetota bacterium]|nr:efflux RND transporter permease subunit [Planctomycetota bacterium]
MDLTRFAITNNRVTFMLLVAILVGGYSAYTTMEQAMDPGFTIRTAQIITSFPGASPDRVEALVTDQLETAIQQLPELDFVSSTSKTGLSIISANIRNEFTEMRPIWDSLRRKIDEAARNLPDGARPPEVNDEFGDVYGTLVAITGDGFDYRELKDFAQQFRDSLLRLENVGKAEIWGTQDERVFVEYNDARLAELNLSVSQLSQILQSRNILISGGSLLAGDERLELEPTGNFNTVEELGRTVISAPGRPDLLFLEDIAEITRGYVDPPSGKVRANGRPALLLAISVREGGNVVTLGEEIKGLLARVRNQYPLGIDFEMVAFEPERVAKKVDDFANSVLQAVAIVLLSMVLMLGLRTGLVVASLVPSALLMSLLVMQWMGLGLNQMTLASLIIALGMLVDNAIVMSESIMVSMSEGMSPVEAAVSSAKELRIPLLTSSLTTSAAFLPIYLAEGSMGEYTGVLFVVVTITLLCSWLLALTVIPLLCTQF